MRKLGFGMSEPKNIVWIAALFCFAAIFTSLTFAQTYKTVTSFNLTNGDDAVYGPLVQGANGNFYGTTLGGGTSSYCKNTEQPFFGCGTVFEMTPGGKVTTLYNFCSQADCADGSFPNGLVLGANGNFYGTTQTGGVYNHGTLFEMTPGGNLTTLYKFCQLSECADGFTPLGTLVQGVNESFYGVTEFGGGDPRECGVGCGTAFEITAEGKLTTLHVFCGGSSCLEGALPQAGLVLATNGNFYGSTYSRGKYEEGAIYEITPSGKTSALYGFCSQSNCTDGRNPESALIQASDGNLYGVTPFGGTLNGGTAFKITLSGELTTLYDFNDTPLSSLTQGTDGNFYGTTWAGGAATDGSLYQLTPAGEVTTLYGFCAKTDCVDGSLPDAGVVQATNGSFYGPTAEGGAIQYCDGGCGTVYSLSMGLAPFVKASPSFGAPEHGIGILGNNLTGTTSVTFNGTATTFTVVSDTYIKATVPTGATSGTIEVTTPNGALSSDVAFQVLP
jgi:uncharacterized repeat protein (TIGR03803 family)